MEARVAGSPSALGLRKALASEREFNALRSAAGLAPRPPNIALRPELNGAPRPRRALWKAKLRLWWKPRHA